jgi:EAL domain-containing protein (putative c-di-GMP-specific phosphodiesterase class I)
MTIRLETRSTVPGIFPQPGIPGAAVADIDIKDIIANRRLVAHFQPIVSVNGGGLLGVEGLSRATRPDSSGLISPLPLFSAAREQGLLVELDCACRDTILRTFKTHSRLVKDSLLFINLDSSILDRVVGSNYLLNIVRQAGLAPENVVIEINEAMVKETALLQQFVETYRRYGFLLALDDVGAGCSNLDRLSLVRPDIVKTDISLARNIHQDFYVKEVFRSLVKLSSNIGALVVAEGVENDDEAAQVLSLGAHMIQGYCLSRPVPAGEIAPAPLGQKMNQIAEKFRLMERSRVTWRAERYWKLESITRDVAGCIARARPVDFNSRLEAAIRCFGEIECAYVLNERGVQVNCTVFAGTAAPRNNRLFSPALPGADHSLKVYYRRLKNAGLEKYLTDPYASLASGNLCRTFAWNIRGRDRRRYILCVDFKVNPMEY